jgi:hypothetical protein
MVMQMILMGCLAVSLRLGEPEPNHFGLDAHVWEGYEAEEAEEHSLETHLMNNTEAKGRRLLILGQFDVGTNLLAKLVKLNFGQSPYYGGMWKHTRPTFGLPNLVQQDPALLVMMRDPLSWLQSVRKSPYNLGSCVHGSDWLSSPCTMTANTSPQNGTHPSVSLSSLEAFWNVWYGEYAELPHKGFNHVVLIRYEDLVLNTERELNRVATAIGSPGLTHVVQQHASAKYHGQSNGRAAAIAKLRSKSYLHLYSSMERIQACTRLDKKLMHDNDYHDC